jgi:hypothetical protein
VRLWHARRQAGPPKGASVEDATSAAVVGARAGPGASTGDCVIRENSFLLDACLTRPTATQCAYGLHLTSSGTLCHRVRLSSDIHSQGGGAPTLEADIWALGAVMAEIAADGRPPFHALSDAAVAELLRDAPRDRAATRDSLQLPDDTPGASLTASTQSLQHSVDRLCDFHFSHSLVYCLCILITQPIWSMSFSTA